ncbi:MAG TPA: hypothetical protein VFK73_06535 [Paludibacter sp.]|nr:hypothetical protein [Paludibacter sp.]
MTVDKSMTKYICSILLLKPTIMMSWGFESPVAINQGLRFRTNGFIHKGVVEIYYNQGVDLFDIRLLKNETEIIKLISNVYVDELVEILDLYIEKVDNYQMRVNQEYNLLSNNDTVN